MYDREHAVTVVVSVAEVARRLANAGRPGIFAFMRPVEARYENGVLKPSEHLDLRQGEHVRLLVLRRSEAARWDMKRLAARGDEDQNLAQAGLDDWAETLEVEERR